MPIIEGTVGPFENAGVPGAGTSEVQTLTIGGAPTSGTFKLAYEGQISGAITWSATNATLLANINAALDAMASIGASGCVATAGTLTSGVGTITLTFGANLARMVVPLITVATNSLVDATPPTIAIVETTPGAVATDEVQTLTIAAGPPTAGTFTLAFDGQTTTAIIWSATNNTLRDRVDAALEALSNIGADNVAVTVGTMTAGVGTLVITFGGALTNTDVALITVTENALTPTAVTLAIAETTPGVTAAFRGAKKGAAVIDTTNGKQYINTGTALAPTWTVTGTQS